MSGGDRLRLIFATQSHGFRLFWRLAGTLRSEDALEGAGFFATNRFDFERFAQAEPAIRDPALDLIREWDLLARADALPQPDREAIEAWERSIGDPTLWHALVIDRRLGFPLRAQFVQDYRPAYDHDGLLKLLGVALEEIAAQFDRVRPHAVVGLNAVTVYDYLYYLMARQRRIPYLQLKLTRVENVVSFFSDPFEVSPHIAERYRGLRDRGASDAHETEALTLARALIERSRTGRLVYEGAIRTAGTAGPGPLAALAGRAARVPAALRRAAQALRATDRHHPAALRYAAYTHAVKPWRRRVQDRLFDVDDVGAFAAAQAGRYALFPLNTEPEVALLAYGRPFRNQIETARLLAAALPVGWTLAVKEHPNARGYRSDAFYRKLRAIPNVRLVPAAAKSGPLLDGAGLVALVYGTIGLEALIKRKPVLTLSRPPYDILPPTMVRYVGDVWRLPDAIRDLLDCHAHDEAALEAYVAAHAATGVRANLFTELLAKGGREVVDGGGSVDQQYRRLAGHLRSRIGEERARLDAPPDGDGIVNAGLSSPRPVA